MQKEQLLEEEFEAESQAQLANLERKSHSSSIGSGNNVASSVRSLPSAVPKDSFGIYQNPKTDKMTYIDTAFDERQSKVTVQISKDFSDSNNLTPKSNLKTDHKKEPSEYIRETVVDKSETFFDDLRNLIGNKTHEKVAQSIDSFIDELVEGEESSIASQTRSS